MSRQLSLYKYLPKRSIQDETSDSGNITVTNIQEPVLELDTDDLTPSIEPVTDPHGSITSHCIVDDIALTPQCSPCQPTNLKFPGTNFSDKARSFNPGWFQQYGWLEYSNKKDAAYCYPCRLFGSTSILTSRPEKSFNSSGFRDWKHATGSKGMLLGHNNCISHKQSAVAWEQFKVTSKTGSVAEHLGSNRAE